MGAGPGWCGSGGPRVKPEESMKHLVFNETEIEGNKRVNIELPIPEQRSTVWHTMKNPYYEDVAVYAIPSAAKPVIADINEKALYERDPISSKPNVKTHLPAPANFEKVEESNILNRQDIIDVTKYLKPINKLALKYYQNASEGENKDVAKVNYYQIARHRGISFSTILLIVKI